MGNPLEPDLFSISCDGSARIREAEGSTSIYGGEETGREPSNETSDEMSMDYSQYIVDLAEVGDLLAHDVHAQPWDCSTSETDFQTMSAVLLSLNERFK